MYKLFVHIALLPPIYIFFRYIDPIFDDDADINKDKYKE